MSPTYSALSAGRVTAIKKALPSLKLVYVLRNPIDVVWSTVRKVIWYEKGAAALDAYSDQMLLQAVLHPANLRWGAYKTNIETWESAFAAQQMHYMFFDDLNLTPIQQINDLCRFLGVAPLPKSAESSVERRINMAPPQGMPEGVREALTVRLTDTIDFLEHRFHRDLSHWRGNAQQQRILHSA